MWEHDGKQNVNALGMRDSLEVEASDTIDTVMAQLWRQAGIPLDQQSFLSLRRPKARPCRITALMRGAH